MHSRANLFEFPTLAKVTVSVPAAKLIEPVDPSVGLSALGIGAQSSEIGHELTRPIAAHLRYSVATSNLIFPFGPR